MTVDHGVMIEMQVAGMDLRFQDIVGGIDDGVSVDFSMGTGQRIEGALVDL
jgi:hypothetical protein